jgi:hypothetical protein
MRIHLQKVVDVGNSLPGKSMVSAAKGQSDEVIGAYHKLNTSLDSTLKQLTSLLETQVPSSSSSSSSASSKSPMTWEAVVAPQMLLRPHWEATLDKWNARLHFGSERKQSKLKVFNQKLWGQIQIALSDKQRVLEKSRMPLLESSRMDRASGDGAAAANLDDGEDHSNKDGDSDSDGDGEGDRVGDVDCATAMATGMATVEATGYGNIDGNVNGGQQHNNQPTTGAANADDCSGGDGDSDGSGRQRWQ